MALDLLGIPATSTPSERLFSRAGEIFNNRRKCMQGDIAQALLNVGSWWAFGNIPGADFPILQHPQIKHLHMINTQLPLPCEDVDGNWRIENEGVSEEVIDQIIDDLAGNDDENGEDMHNVVQFSPVEIESVSDDDL